MRQSNSRGSDADERMLSAFPPQVDREYLRGQLGHGEWVHLPQPVIDQLAAYPGVMIADRIAAALADLARLYAHGAGRPLRPPERQAPSLEPSRTPRE